MVEFDRGKNISDESKSINFTQQNLLIIKYAKSKRIPSRSKMANRQNQFANFCLNIYNFSFYLNYFYIKFNDIWIIVFVNLYSDLYFRIISWRNVVDALLLRQICNCLQCYQSSNLCLMLACAICNLILNKLFLINRLLTFKCLTEL